MKARTPRICRVLAASGPKSLCGRPRPLAWRGLSSCGARRAEPGALSRLRPCAARFFAATARVELSLADRIKQLLPADATETARSPARAKNEILYESQDDVLDDARGGSRDDARDESRDELRDEHGSVSPRASLAAFEAEVATAVALAADEFDFRQAGQYLLSHLPLQHIISAVVARIAPAILRGPTGELGVAELAFALRAEGHGALASQLLEALDMAQYLPLFSTMEKMMLMAASRATLSTAELHALLRDALALTSASGRSRGGGRGGGRDGAAPGLNFPQLLSADNLAAWWKARLMVLLDPRDFRRWLHNYAAHFDARSAAFMLLVAPAPHHTAIADWVVRHRDAPGLVSAVMRVVQTPPSFRLFARPLLRAAPVSSAAEASMLAAALRLGQTYDVANVCRHGAKHLHHPEHDVLLAKALLAAAFAQRMPQDRADLHGLVALPSSELRTFLVRRVLTPVLGDDAARNAVLGRAAAKLSHLYEKHRVPGRVLWQLLMSMPGPLTGASNAPLARLVTKRPYAEQVRYMSLPIVSADSITQLLKWHIAKIMEYRRLNGVDLSVPQAKEDIQLLVVGMLLASEKKAERSRGASPSGAASSSAHGPVHSIGVAQGTAQSIAQSIASSADQGALEEVNAAESVGRGKSHPAPLAKPGGTPKEQGGAPSSTASATAATTAATTSDTSLLSVVNELFRDSPLGPDLDKAAAAASAATAGRELSASIAFYVVAELVRQKSYTVARQLLRMVGPQRVPAPVLNKLLLSLAADQPEDSYKFVTWLVKENRLLVQPKCINQMLSILTRSRLTESQLMNRFQSLRILMRTSLKAPVDAAAAADLVDAFIESARLRGRGSQERLRWALQVAKFANVSRAEFDRWNIVLESMYENRQGYWTDTP